MLVTAQIVPTYGNLINLFKEFLRVYLFTDSFIEQVLIPTVLLSAEIEHYNDNIRASVSRTVALNVLKGYTLLSPSI